MGIMNTKPTEEQIRQATAFIMAEPEGEGPVKENATPGNIWVCLACGKTSPNRYWSRSATPGWDESCMLRAEQFPIEKLERNDSGRVLRIKEDNEKV